MRLLPQDYEFIEIVQEEISEHSAIPLEIKPDKIIKIIKESAKYFYEWHPQAIERKHFIVLKNDIDNARTDKLNAPIKLNDSIKFIFGIRRIGSTIMSEATYIDNNMMGLGRFSTSNSTDNDIMSTVLSMYEFQSYENIFDSRGVAHSWSELSKKIVFLSDVDTDLVLECGVEIPVTDLYNDRLFLQYVKGKALMSLSRIIGTYDFKLIGGVSINWSDLSTDGKEMIEEVKDELKTYNTNNFILY